MTTTEEVTMTHDLKCDLLEAHVKLRLASERASVDILTDIRVMASDGEGEPPHTVERYLHKGSWVELLPGLKIMLLDNSDLGTRALTEGSGAMPEHHHTFTETIFVISGEVLEHTTGRVYYAGMSYSHAPGERHAPEIRGLIMVTWYPPLPAFTGCLKKAAPLVLHLTKND